jgi:hypothetical protein
MILLSFDKSNYPPSDSRNCFGGVFRLGHCFERLNPEFSSSASFFLEAEESAYRLTKLKKLFLRLKLTRFETLLLCTPQNRRSLTIGRTDCEVSGKPTGGDRFCTNFTDLVRCCRTTPILMQSFTQCSLEQLPLEVLDRRQNPQRRGCNSSHCPVELWETNKLWSFTS